MSPLSWVTFYQNRFNLTLSQNNYKYSFQALTNLSSFNIMFVLVRMKRTTGAEAFKSSLCAVLGVEGMLLKAYGFSEEEPYAFFVCMGTMVSLARYRT